MLGTNTVRVDVGYQKQGCVGGGGGTHPPPTRQQIGKLLSQSATLDWLKITTEETKIDFLIIYKSFVKRSSDVHSRRHLLPKILTYPNVERAQHNLTII